jgi:hypothetical protein
MGFRGRIGHPVLVRLYDYWLARRLGREVPLRAAIDPVAIPDLLPHLFIAERAGEDDFRYRLIGTAMVRAIGRDYTGRRLSELPVGTALALARELFGPVMRDGVPVYSQGPFRWPDREHRWTARLYLPMSSDGTRVDMALNGQVFMREPPDGAEALIRPATDAEVAHDTDAAGLAPTT